MTAHSDSLTDNPALVEGLRAAVPLRLMELAALIPQERERRIKEWAQQAADEVSHRGDVLLFGSKKKGAAAEVFNALAKGLAAGAYVIGGITFAGDHWCADRCACVHGLARGNGPSDPIYSSRTMGRHIEDVQLPEEDVSQ